MCGITGIIGDIDWFSPPEVVWKQAMCTWIRGVHATGLLNVYEDKSTEVVKSIGGPDCLRLGAPTRKDKSTYFDVDHNTGSVFLEYKAKVAPVMSMFHHRAATVGGWDDRKGIHPFTHGPLIGCHNGTLNPGWQKLLKPQHKDETDSTALIRYLSKAESPEHMAELLGKVEGAYALVMYHKKWGRAILSRNYQRPLSIATSRGMIRFASEEWVLKRNGVLDYNANGTASAMHETIGTLEPLKLAVVDPADFSNNELWEVPRFQVGFKGNYTPPKTTTFSGGRIPQAKVFTGFEGDNTLTFTEWKEKTKDGCAVCGIEFKSNIMSKDIEWIDDQSPLCGGCANAFRAEIDEAKNQVHYLKNYREMPDYNKKKGVVN